MSDDLKVKINGRDVPGVKAVRWKARAEGPAAEGRKISIAGGAINVATTGQRPRRVVEPSDDDMRNYSRWLAERPERVRVVAERFDPWTLCRLRPTGQRVFIIAWDEAADGTVTARVGISGDYNVVALERQVFGIDPADLEPCDPPNPDELVGAPPEAVQEAIIDSLCRELEE